MPDPNHMGLTPKETFTPLVIELVTSADSPDRLLEIAKSTIEFSDAATAVDWIGDIIEWLFESYDIADGGLITIDRQSNGRTYAFTRKPVV